MARYSEQWALGVPTGTGHSNAAWEQWAGTWPCLNKASLPAPRLPFSFLALKRLLKALAIAFAAGAGEFLGFSKMQVRCPVSSPGLVVGDPDGLGELEVPGRL